MGVLNNTCRAGMSDDGASRLVTFDGCRQEANLLTKYKYECENGQLPSVVRGIKVSSSSSFFFFYHYVCYMF